MPPVKRPYESPRRRQQAEATRRAIVDAARHLFLRDGYGATTVDAIAREAGVAPQTVYAAFGTKRAISIAILDSLDAATGAEQYLRDLAASAGEPRRQLRLLVGFDRRLYERGHEVIMLARNAGTTEPDLLGWYREGERRHRHYPRPYVADWARRGALRPGLTEQEAADILAALTNFDMFRLLVLESGWSPERYEQWIGDALEELLFA